MKLRCMVPIYLASLFVLLSPPLSRAEANARRTSSTKQEQVAVTVRPALHNTTSLRRVSDKAGRLFVRDVRSHSYRFLVKRGRSAAAVVKALRSDKAVLRAAVWRAGAPRVVRDLASVKSLDRTLRTLELKATQREDKSERERRVARSAMVSIAGDPKRDGEEEENGTDYIRAYRYWYSQRAFPGDKIPANAYRKAILQRAKLKPAPLGKKRRNQIGVESVGGAWEFAGPKNLDVPSRRYFGPRPVTGRANAIAYDPNSPGTYYVGAAGGGLWVTTDAGANWTPLGDAWTFMQVSSIAVDPKDSQTIYVGTGDYDGFGLYSFGLLKTTDGGITWDVLGANLFGGSAISRIVVDPDNSQAITISTGRGFNYGASFVWHSEDGGQNWNAAIPVASNWQCVAIGVIGPKARRYMFAIGDNEDFWRSDNRGKNWVQMTSPVGAGEATLAMSAIDFATLYVISASDEKVYKSIDTGQTWNDITGTLDDWGQAWYDMVITATPGIDAWGLPEDVMHIGLVDTYQDYNELVDWRSIGGPGVSANALVHVDQHGFVNNPLDASESLAANDGGAYRFTFDRQRDTWEWTSLNQNLGITQFYKGAWHPTDPNIMLGGSQDNATPVSNGDLDNWINRIGGDGGGVAINPVQPQIQYGTIYGAQVFRTGNLWDTTTNITPNTGNDNLPFVTVIQIDPNDPDVLYLGTNFLWQWNDKTAVWTPRIGAKDLSPNGVITAIEVFNGHRDRIYVGTSDGLVWLTTEFRTFTQLNGPSSGFPLRSVTGVSVNPNDRDDILVSVSGFGTGHLWRCDDTRAITPLFTDVSGSGVDMLPDVPVNAIARDPWNPDSTWFVATDIGVFMTSDAGQTWTNATAPLGLPNVQVNDIGTNKTTGYLNVATYGRGMWRIGILPDVALIDTLTLSPNTASDGSSVIATLKLKYPAPPGGALVNITTTDAVNTTVPASITVPENATTQTFTITTQPVLTKKTATITATSPANGSSAGAVLTLQPLVPSSVTVDPNPAIAGFAATGTVTLNYRTVAGATVTLASSSPSIASVPASVVVDPTKNTATFAITIPDSSVGKSVDLSATLNGVTVKYTLQIVGVLESVTLKPAVVLGGQPVTGTVKLRLTAPVGGVVVNLASSNTGVATVPSSITVPAGSATKTFTVTTIKPASDTTVKVTASSHSSSASADLTVVSAIRLTLALSPTAVRGGLTSTGTITLNAPAPAGGIVITVSSANPSVAYPTATTLAVSAGATQRKFTINTVAVNASTDVAISATYGASTATATLTVLPDTYPTNSVFKPNPACANAFTIGTVTLNAPAPAGGASVAMSSSNPSVATVPATVTIPAGALSASYTVSCQDVPVDSVTTITATYAGVSKGSTLTVKASMLTSVALSPANVKGGTSVTLTINLSCPAGPNGAVIALKSSNPAVLPVPTTVVVPAGKTAANFSLKSNAVAATDQATVTATYNGVSRGATVTVVP